MSECDYHRRLGPPPPSQETIEKAMQEVVDAATQHLVASVPHEMPTGSCLVCGHLRSFAVWHELTLAGVCQRCRDARHVVLHGATLATPRTSEELLAATHRIMQHYLGEDAPAYGDARFVVDYALELEGRLAALPATSDDAADTAHVDMPDNAVSGNEIASTSPTTSQSEGDDADVQALREKFTGVGFTVADQERLDRIADRLDETMDSLTSANAEIAGLERLADEYHDEWQSAVERANASEHLRREAAAEVLKLQNEVAGLNAEIDERVAEMTRQKAVHATDLRTLDAECERLRAENAELRQIHEHTCQQLRNAITTPPYLRGTTYDTQPPTAGDGEGGQYG